MEGLNTCSHCKSCSQRSMMRGFISAFRTSSAMWICSVLFLSSLLQVTSSAESEVFTPSRDSVERYSGKSSDTETPYFRKFYVDKDGENTFLYIGAMNYVYKLNVRDGRGMKVSRSENLPASSDSIKKCKDKKMQQESDCQNHIRSVTFNGENAEVAGTGAYEPMLYSINKKTLLKKGARTRGLGYCPYSPRDNATILKMYDDTERTYFVYSATMLDESRNDPVIYRPAAGGLKHLRTERQDQYWLKNAQFVRTFNHSDYVYFFFRETALERQECDNVVYSRVARVCKSDRGGYEGSALVGRWTSFLKARIMCSVGSNPAFEFNELYDVRMEGDKFVGVFGTNHKEGFYGSAMCSFTVSEIESVFNGPVKNSTNKWKPIKPPQDIGKCQQNSQNLRNELLQFIKAYPLMDQAAQPELRTPMFSHPNTIIQRLVLKTVSGKGGEIYNITFLGTNQGQVFKVLHWNKDGRHQSRVLGIMNLVDTAQPIWDLEIFGHYLYASTDKEIIKLDVRQCDRYKYCTSCARDPYCGWNKKDNQCENFGASSLVQDVYSEPSKICRQCSNGLRTEDSTYKHSGLAAGDWLHLVCPTSCDLHGKLQWKINKVPLKDIQGSEREKYQLTESYDLIIKNISYKDHNNSYDCEADLADDGVITLASHHISVPPCGKEDAKCIWKQEFRTWCDEFKNYKKEFNNWVCLKNNCQNQSCGTAKCPNTLL